MVQEDDVARSTPQLSVAVVLLRHQHSTGKEISDSRQVRVCLRTAGWKTACDW